MSARRIKKARMTADMVDGEIDLDAPLITYLPGFRMASPEYTPEPMTATAWTRPWARSIPGSTGPLFTLAPAPGLERLITATPPAGGRYLVDPSQSSVLAAGSTTVTVGPEGLAEWRSIVLAVYGAPGVAITLAVQQLVC